MIHLCEPKLSEADEKALLDCIKRSWVATRGPASSEFAEKINAFSSHDFTNVCNSGTTALELSLRALELEPGSYVAVPTSTYIATVSAIILAGYRPYFYTVDESLQPRISCLEKVFSDDSVKALVLVSLYGYPIDEEAICQIARKNKLAVVFDTAEALGTKHQSRFLGSYADFSCFSFNGNKIITSGAGGAINCSDKNLKMKVESLLDHGKDQSGEYSDYGGNFMMSDLQASLGLSQIKRLELNLLRKKEIFDRYRSELSNKDFDFIDVICNGTCNFWLSAIKVLDADLKTLIEAELTKENIKFGRFFSPINKYSYYESFPITDPQRNPLEDSLLLLPSSVGLSKEEQSKVIRIMQGVSS